MTIEPTTSSATSAPAAQTKPSMSSKQSKRKSAKVDLEAEDSGEVDLYKEFGLSKTASQEQIKKAYYRLCLKYHPDKVTALTTDKERAQATLKFQELNHKYAILSDPARRSRYDATGYVGEVGSSDGGAGLFDGVRPEGGWEKFFSELWSGLVTEDSISKFELKYRGSDEEKRDVIKYYLQSKGSMDRVLDAVPCSTADDEDRFRTIVLEALESGEITERHEKFLEVNERARQRRKKAAEKEAKEAEKAKKASAKKKGDGLDELQAMIRQKGKSRLDDLIASLEAKEASKKGAKKGGAGKKKKEEEAPKELDDEAFEALQKKLFSGAEKDGAAVGGLAGKKKAMSGTSKKKAQEEEEEEEVKEENDEDSDSDDWDDEEDEDEVDELEDDAMDAAEEVANLATSRAKESNKRPSKRQKV
ncbi:hypothetical protein HDV05_004562 [Chytridiales sp. JEL 0842]|nr:hypothetical protein HDV05_004562 [Chytridiales sp. JEL 0842]